MDGRFLSITRLSAAWDTPTAMKSILRLLMTGLLAGVLFFCVFGFMATLEAMPTAARWTWRIIYSLAGVFNLAGMAFTWGAKLHKEVA